MEEKMEATKLLSPAQAAAYLNCTVSKIRKDIHNKKLAVVRVGRLVRIPQSFLDEWVKANTFMPQTGNEQEDEKKSA
jgi:excisionase family DNA binding protein